MGEINLKTRTKSKIKLCTKDTPTDQESHKIDTCTIVLT